MDLKALVQKFYGWVGQFSHNAVRYDHVMLAILAVIIGLMSAYGAIAFRFIIAEVQLFSFQTDNLLADPSGLAWWQILFVPILGGLFVGLLFKFFSEREKPSAVAEVIEANALHDGKMSLKEGITNAIATSVSLGVGASAGREGPVVHLGATLASALAQKLNLTPAVGRTLLACGVASAVASSFNAPIAGVFFALEVVMGHYAIHAFAPVVIAGVTGTMITRIHLGDYPAFTIPDLVIASPFEFPAFLILGIISALCGIFFMRSLIFAEDNVKKINVPTWALPAIGGLFIGLIGLFLPEVLGVGYEATDNALQENYGFFFLVTLLFAKIIATAISLGFRFGGGVFSPSLYLGAMLGGAFGYLATGAYSGESSDIAVYTIVGMGAVASSVLGAPISTILIVFELTADYSITIAVMIASAVASLTTGLMHKTSYFYWQLERRGHHLEDGKAKYLLKSMTVSDLIDRDFITINRSAKIKEVRDFFLAQTSGKLLVINDAGALHGVITSSDLSGEAFDPEMEDLIRADDICRKKPVFILNEESLESTLNLMEGSGEDHLPVLNDRETKTVVGLVHYRDVIGLYNQALADSQAEQKGLNKISEK